MTKKLKNTKNSHSHVYVCETDGKNITSSLKIKESDWLNSKEAAEYLRISQATLRNMTSNGRLPYCKLGRSNRYSLQELESLLLKNKRGVIHGN